MSEIQYGLISKVDAAVLEKTVDLICKEFNSDRNIKVTEIGIFGGQTARGINEYIQSKDWAVNGIVSKHRCNYIAIDNQKDKTVLPPFEGCNLIIGNSNEVYNQIEDNSQHLCFIDGCHCFAHVISDFFCYAPKVKIGGYLAFHDTGKHIKPFKDFQHGDKNNPDSYISARKALGAIGLLEDEDLGFIKYVGYDEWGENDRVRIKNWELIFDEAYSSDLAGGVTVFKKLY